jgi:cytochrome c oxidase subunit IV
LGIAKPEFLTEGRFMRMKYLNWIFILLTVFKAYYITWDFMHMRDEVKGLRRAVVWTAIFLICYLVFILLTEGDYIFDVYDTGFQSWDF